MIDAFSVANPEGCDVCGRDACEDHLPSLPTVGSDARPPAPLQFFTLAELAARVRAAGPRRYLFRGLWPAGDYGVLSAEMKAQKTWTATDFAVSGASGTPLLGRFPCDAPGPVIMFFGEGSEGNAWRRLAAVARARGLEPESLPIVVCTRAPHLSDPEHLALLEAKVAALRPVAVIVDPLYLAARGADGGSLYGMGAVLEGVQHACQRHGAALLVVHHHNRREGSGAGRMSGAGPAEWGRVLLTLDVKSRHTDPETRQTTVITEMQVIGGEVADDAVRIVRRVRALDPNDLNSPLEVQTTVEAVQGGAAEAPVSGLGPAATKVMEALKSHPEGITIRQIGDVIAKQHGHGLRRETISRQLAVLARRGAAPEEEGTAFHEKTWRPCDPCDVTRDLTPSAARVTACDLSLGGHAAGSHGGGHTRVHRGLGHTMGAS